MTLTAMRVGTKTVKKDARWRDGSRCGTGEMRRRCHSPEDRAVAGASKPSPVSRDARYAAHRCSKRWPADSNALFRQPAWQRLEQWRFGVSLHRPRRSRCLTDYRVFHCRTICQCGRLASGFGAAGQCSIQSFCRQSARCPHPLQHGYGGSRRPDDSVVNRVCRASAEHCRY